MDVTFETIGLEVPSEKAFNYLAERAGDQGEATQLTRRGAVLHGRCWKLGEGLEVWTVLYESETGDIFYADCRPGFRARYTQRISPWALTEYDEEGEAIVHGYCDGTETEVLINRRSLRGGELAVGAHIAAEVWLQGHVLDKRTLQSRYEGLDHAYAPAARWARLRRRN